jgi:hypothetical protein
MGIKVPEKKILISHIRCCLVFHTPTAIVRLPFASAIFYTEQMVVKAVAEVKLKKQCLSAPSKLGASYGVKVSIG